MPPRGITEVAKECAMRSMVNIILAALLCGVANNVAWAQAPAAPASVAAPAKAQVAPGVEITQSGDGAVTITVHRTGRDDKGKVVRKSTSAQLKQQQFKTRRRADGSDWQEETLAERRCTKRDGVDDHCVEWDNQSYSAREKVEAGEGRAKAYADAAVAVVRLPTVTQLEGDRFVTRAMLPGHSCPVDQMENLGGGSYRCKVAVTPERYDPVHMARALGDRVGELEPRVMRKPTDASQRTEVWVGGGALMFTGFVDSGGPAVVADVVADLKGWTTNLALHGAVASLSDGQGRGGCVSVGGVRPTEAGSTTTVGVLGGWCGSDNSDLNGANFWHVNLQARYRLARWFSIQADLLGGVMFAERVVNQAVVEDRDPQIGAMFSAAVDVGRLF